MSFPYFLSFQAHLLTVEQVSSLRNLFELQDTEHVGTLSSGQLLQLLHACDETHLCEADVQRMLKDISQPDDEILTQPCMTQRRLMLTQCCFCDFVAGLDNAQCTFEVSTQPSSTHQLLSSQLPAYSALRLRL